MSNELSVIKWMDRKKDITASNYFDPTFYVEVNGLKIGVEKKFFVN